MNLKLTATEIMNLIENEHSSLEELKQELAKKSVNLPMNSDAFRTLEHQRKMVSLKSEELFHIIKEIERENSKKVRNNKN